MALNGLLLITTNLKQSFERLGPVVRIILALTVQKHVGLQIGYRTNGNVLGLIRKSRFRCSKAAQSSTTKRRNDRGSSGLRTILRCTHWNVLTYSMVQSPSWAANWFAASQEIPRISRNPKVHYRIHKRPPPVPILGQPSPVHIPTFHFLEIHHNIIHPSTPRSPQWSLSLRFPHQGPIHSPLLTHTRHMPSPSHSSFYRPHDIGWEVQII